MELKAGDWYNDCNDCCKAQGDLRGGKCNLKTKSRFECECGAY